MKNRLDAEIADEQAGFRSGRGTRDLKTIMKKRRETDKKLYICFIDYSKAFDMVSHESYYGKVYVTWVFQATL